MTDTTLLKHCMHTNNYQPIQHDALADVARALEEVNGITDWPVEARGWCASEALALTDLNPGVPKPLVIAGYVARYRLCVEHAVMLVRAFTTMQPVCLSHDRYAAEYPDAI